MTSLYEGNTISYSLTQDSGSQLTNGSNGGGDRRATVDRATLEWMLRSMKEQTASFRRELLAFERRVKRGERARATEERETCTATLQHITATYLNGQQQLFREVRQQLVGDSMTPAFDSLHAALERLDALRRPLAEIDPASEGAEAGLMKISGELLDTCYELNEHLEVALLIITL